jgi:hypothetical protein
LSLDTSTTASGVFRFMGNDMQVQPIINDRQAEILAEKMRATMSWDEIDRWLVDAFNKKRAGEMTEAVYESFAFIHKTAVLQRLGKI